MPSSITLTVADLAISTSFFLSALQPLGYVYRSRCESTIGFGLWDPPSVPADFWITQEIVGVPAGAAHVSFPAPCRAAVHAFFTAAVKAGGKIHDEPTTRDSNGYYSAAVIDFDGNSIEAVHRPFIPDDHDMFVSSTSSLVNSKTPTAISMSTATRSSPSQNSQTRSTTSIIKLAAVPTQVEAVSAAAVHRRPSDNFLETLSDRARTAANLVEQVAQQRKASDLVSQSQANSDTLVGTLLGVAAGAALIYAFTRRDSGNKDQERRPEIIATSITEPVIFAYSRSPRDYQQREQASYTYPAIEAPLSKSQYDQDPRLINLEDNDPKSEHSLVVRPASTRVRSEVDHAAISGMSGHSRGMTQESEASRRTAPKAMANEAASFVNSAQTSNGQAFYEAPTYISAAETTISHTKSQARSLPERSTGERSTGASVSTHSHHSETSKKGSRRSDLPTKDESVTRTATFPKTSSSRSSASTSRHSGPKYSKSGSPPSDSRSRSSQSVSKASTVKPARKALSALTTIHREKEPEEYPVPVSRAATWTGSIQDSRSQTSKVSKHARHSKHTSASDHGRHSSSSRHPSRSRRSEKSGGAQRERHGPDEGAEGGFGLEMGFGSLLGSKAGSKVGGGSKIGSRVTSRNGRSGMTESVVGKVEEISRLNVSGKEVAPEDSVSQIY